MGCGAVAPESGELRAFAQLIGNFAPDEGLFEAQPSIEGHEAGVTEGGFAGELEDGLVGLSAEAAQPLGEQGLHAPGDVVLIEEIARGGGSGRDHVRQVFHLFAHRVIESHRVQFAGILDGEQHRY